ncbi:hypothetical protein CDAR_214011 [Caerostris darwini]|uniref:Uncharacterized protein n=1 Tax=Caerostris darwini TaxID=1538125 RepID=A0AAV4SFP3_9ARAC|nr:hypothetical protein CDAR_214011 [Caerostris darwini]
MNFLALFVAAMMSLAGAHVDRDTKRSFSDLGCMGVYDKAKFARLDRLMVETNGEKNESLFSLETYTAIIALKTSRFNEKIDFVSQTESQIFWLEFDEFSPVTRETTVSAIYLD